jgi:hypothetical protein
VRILEVDRELAVAVEEAVRDSVVESTDQFGDVADLDHALERSTRREPERHRVDHAEEAVAADREPKQLGVLLTAARPDVAVAVNERERLHVLDNRLEREAASVHVRRQGPAQREAIGSRLLLPDSPRRVPTVLSMHQV